MKHDISTLQTLFLQPTSSAEGNETICQPQDSTWILPWIFIPVFQVILNTVVVTATYRNRRKLRHNYVYAYVISVLVGNAVFGILSIYNFLNYGLILERFWFSESHYRVDMTNSYHRAIQQWWSFRQSLTAGLFLITNTNVSALIYGLRESFYFVGRKTSLDNRENRASLRSRRRKAVAIITCVWSLPMVLVCTGLGNWNCLDYCICVSAEYKPGFHYCQTDKHKECSRIWQPLSHVYLLIFAVLWCVEIIGIVIMLITTVRKFYDVMNPRPTLQQDEDLRSNGDRSIIKLSDMPTYQSAVSAISHNNNYSVISHNSNHSAVSIGEDAYTRNEVEGVKSTKERSCCFFTPRFCNHTIRLLFVLSFLFFATTLPTIAMIFIDATNKEFVLIPESIPPIIAVSMLYGVISPIVLVYYLPGLRSAIESLIFSIKCCTRTTVRGSK